MPHYLLFRYGCHGISISKISHRYDNDVNRSNCNPSRSLSPPPNEKSSQKFHPSRLSVSRNVLISTLIISEFPHENVSLKKKRKKDIFNERRIFNIFHPRYRRVTCRDRSRDISPHLFPRSNFMQIHRRISITTIKPGLETVLASIETLRSSPKSIRVNNKRDV